MTFNQEVQKLVEAAEKRGEDEYRGMDWFQLTDAESSQFGISRAEFPRLLVAWQTYLAFCDIIAPEDADLTARAVERERLRFPQYFESCVVSDKAFEALASEWCGVAPDKARAMYEKVRAWNRRDAEMGD